MIWRLWAFRLPVACGLLGVLAWYAGWPWIGLAVVFAVVLAVAAFTPWAPPVAEAVRDHERAHIARCRIRWTWQVAVEGANLIKVGVPPVIIGPIQLADGGLVFRVRPSPGHHVQTWNDAAAGLCKWWKCSELEVRDHLTSPRWWRRGGQPTDLVEVSCSLAGILLAPVRWPHGIPDRVTWGRATLPLGHFAGGRPASLSLDEQHLMVGGPPGAGKSTLLHTMFCGLALLDDEALVVLDLKGVDLEPWRARSAAFCHSRDEAAPVLRWVAGLMNSRLETMRAEGVAKWRPHPAGPHVTVVIDEYAELDAELFATWDRLARLGRAAGISLVTCTQRPAAELGDWFTRIRANSVARVAMGPVGPEETGMVIGRQHVPRSFVTLPVGVGRLVSGESHGRVFRAYWSDRAVREVAAASVDRRPKLEMVDV